jgi:hypothetical protein
MGAPCAGLDFAVSLPAFFVASIEAHERPSLPSAECEKPFEANLDFYNLLIC